jgi:diguanylate cyclase (GGDEF)-like protein
MGRDLPDTQGVTTAIFAKLLLGLPRGVAEIGIVGGSIGLSIIGTLVSMALLKASPEGMLPYLVTAVAVPLLVATPIALVTMHLLRALDRARREAQLLAGTDELTGVHNRRRWLALAERALDRAAFDAGSIAVLVLDIDDFKEVNDDHGHAVGDDVLVAVAAACVATLRPDDAVARWGGEEFVALLPGASGDDALHAAERVRAAVAATMLDVRGRKVSVTVSVGTADSRQAGYEIDRLVTLADSAMYRAKKAGKNRVDSAKTEPPDRRPAPRS